MNWRVDFRQLEAKWRPYWRAIDLYRTEEQPDRPKYYILDYFPYPSGEGLSVGHCRNYVPTCVNARYLRMTGHNVLHPMGWDAFGLPAENYAILHNVHPRETTRRQAANYRRQLELVECSYDWSREINSSDPDYYRWTQWFFLLLHERGLAYRAMSSQWWCPVDQTILANEQVEEGRCWRCGNLVAKKELPQWFFKITDYAERLLADLDQVNWPESIKQMQRNWIGRREGAEITFPLSERVQGEAVAVFTTRPDTLYGVTFLAIAPEHPLTKEIVTPARRAVVEAYIAEAIRQPDVDRLATNREQSGVFSGAYAVHPLTGEPLPIWVADYVLTSYGTGAVMGVPGHDTRDFAFARRYNLPVVEVIQPVDGQADDAGCYTGHGLMINSGPFSGLPSEDGGERIVTALAERGRGKEAVSYRLRDWLISRQRYWGAPIPMIHCAECGIVPVPRADLPVQLPEIDDFAPQGDGKAPLARVDSWVNTTCPQCAGPARRETDTMDGFACSSWYFLRFADTHHADGPFNPEAVSYWLPVDTYVGGAEHAVMHLLFARFWTKVMADAGLIGFTEPFTQLRNQGVLHAPDGRRMSKSKGNVITPDEVIAVHGTDALRTYIVFMGPFEASVNWTETGIKGVTRFLDRFWQLAQERGAVSKLDSGEWPQPDNPAHAAFRRRQHRTIQRLTGDMQAFRFNTAVAALMEWLNELLDTPAEAVPPAGWREAIATFCLLLAPIAPFVTEEVWQEVLGNRESVHRQTWPEWDEAIAAADEVTIAVQVNGKLRATISVPAGSEEDTLREAALADPNVRKYVNGKTIRRVIVAPDRLVNLVV